jgi:hypothetical protein
VSLSTLQGSLLQLDISRKANGVATTAVDLAALQTGVQSVRFEVFTAVTTRNAVFWDIKNQFVPLRRHITSPL